MNLSIGLRKKDKDRYIHRKKIDRKREILKERIIWSVCIFFSIVLAYLTVFFVVEQTSVSDDSMLKTLKKDDNIIINKFIYDLVSPKRFDVIVFEQNSKERNYYDVKRVIGLPGEKIFIKDGIVYVDDEALDEKIDVENCNNPGLAESEIVLGKNEYFVLGDNRNNSEDSRFANIGVVDKEDIIGKAFFRINDFSIIANINTNK